MKANQICYRTIAVATITLTITVALVAQPALAGSCGSSQAAQTASVKSDIVDTAVEAGTFETLVAAVNAAGLVEALKGEGPLTVFAPNDEAFAKLPEGTLDMLLRPENREMLVSILTYHVSPGSLTAAEVIAMDRVETLNGQQPRILVDSGVVMIGGAKVTATDIMASNGVIHVIDSVILPENLQSAIAAEAGDTLVANAR